jgi:tripartite-type tricarboxylate transporter receptor subunit TctC
MMRRRTLSLAFAAGLASKAASANDYPSRPVKVVVPISAGSATDVVARLAAESLREALSQPFLVDNRPGAGGSLGSAVVAKAPPDGYTLLVVSSAHTANPALYASLPYDTAKEFRGITMLATLPLILVVAPSSNIRSVKDLLALAKAKAGQITYASSGVGSALHMGSEKFRAMAGFEGVHVPYRGTPEALTDVMAGRVDFAFISIGNTLSPIKEGKLVALATSTAKRSRMLPDVPTTVEVGIANSSYEPWIGMFAPAGTPNAIVDALNKPLVKALESPDMVAKLAAVGAEPAPMSPAAFDAYVARELVDTKELVRVAKIPLI